MNKQYKLGFFFFLLSLYCYSQNDLTEYLLDKERTWHVINVNTDDILVLRKRPTYKSELVTTIPYNAITLTNDDKIRDTIGDWIAVVYYNTIEKKHYRGWVKRRYVEENKIWKKLNTKYMVLTYPAFLELFTKNDVLFLTHKVAIKYEQYLDGRDGVVESVIKEDFHMTIHSYVNLEIALEKHFLEYSELKENKKGLGYIIRTGSEGVGEIYKIVKKGNRVFVLALRYNINKMTLLQKNVPFLISEEEGRKIQNQITLQLKALE